MDELDVFLSGITPRFLTSEEIYGPVEIESTRLSLKMIPSLVGNPSVDLICDSIVALTQTSDLLAMKKIMLKFVRGINHISVNCHDAERSRVFEVIAMHFERNMLHTQYSVQFWSVFLPPLPAEIQISDSKPGLIAYINQLQENLQQLPSLAAAGDIVLEFCNTLKLAFGNQSTEAFFRIGYCLNKLFVATSLQDRAQLLRYFNGLREAQLDDVDDLVTRAEEITLK
ncbi:hypothetical protein BDR26DRAFT_866719 [Obelidium mucronatum]|nr:hypothetical protein BDR26DRAFT_866719 [Obelidium mucronatum]